MPTLGRPQSLESNNLYQGVKKYEGANSNLKQLKKIKNAGTYLNFLAGNKNIGSSGVEFVDGKKHGKLEKDGFLRLLMHQLANQDPLKPVDQSKMSADLAQFSQLEQMTNMNKNLEKSLSDNMIRKKFFSASFLGKKVITKGSTIKYHGGGSSAYANFETPREIEKGFVRVYDKKNQMIAQIDLGKKTSGTHNIPWDGKRLDGVEAIKGVYRFEVKAWDQTNIEIPIITKAEGVISGVSFNRNGEPLITIDGKKISLRDVSEFYMDASEVNNNEKLMADKSYQETKNPENH